MKEKRIKRKWQRLLATAVLLLSVVIQAQADVHFVPVDAGWDENGGKWWVKVKNIGSENFSQTDKKNDKGETIEEGTKLGIYFKVCTAGTTGETGVNTGTWNDETTWSINAGETAVFYTNGGKQDGNGTPNFDELSGNTTYTLEIEVYNHDGLKKYGVIQHPDRFGTVNFTLSADKKSVNIIESTKNFYGMNEGGLFDVTIDGKTVSVYQLRGTGLGSDDNNTASEYNRPKKLVKDNWYYFGEAPVGEYATRSVLWDKYVVDGKTIFMFKGITAYYRIQKVTKLTKRKGHDDVQFTTHTFLKVEPLNGEFTEVNWNKIYTERTKEFQDRDKMFPSFSKDNNDETWGYGCLYIAGSSGFGYGEYDKYVGWDAQWEPDGYDQNFILADNQMWVPSPEPNLYKFRLQGGGNISNDKSKGFDVKFYLHNYLKKYKNVTDNGNKDNWRNYERLNSWRGGNVDNENAIDIDKDYPYLMHLPESRDFFEITTHISESGNDEKLNSPDWKNGNFKTRAIGFDSDTPALPEGYIFEITIDLRDKEPDTWKEQTDGTNGIEVKVERIKDEFALGFVNLDLTTWNEGKNQNEDIHFIPQGEKGNENGSTSCEVYLSKFNKKEIKNPNRDITKRIKLRDALRFDYGIPFARQYTTGSTDDIIKFNNLIIHGALSDDDMQYLSWLSRNNKLVNLDLTDAILPNGVIPGPQIIDNETNVTDFGGNSETLKKVTMPENGVKGIGNNAFKGCTGLTNMAEIVKVVNGYIGESAFENCTYDKTTKIEIPSTVTSIRSKAFAHDTQITKIVLPNGISAGSVVEEEHKFNTDLDGTTYGTLKGFDKNATPYSYITLEAEDFNTVKGKGFDYAQLDKSNSYRTDEDGKKVNLENTYNLSHIRGGDYFKYNFTTAKRAKYSISVRASHGTTDGTAYTGLKLEIDGNVIANDATLAHTGIDKWNTFIENNDVANFIVAKGEHTLKATFTNPDVNPDWYKITLIEYVEDAQGPVFNIADDAFIVGEIGSNKEDDIKPNDCEVVFDNVSDDNVAEYRNKTGVLKVLTKTLDENAVYSCVNQRHADVYNKRTFARDNDHIQNNWYSVVYPFPVTDALIKSVNDGDAFDWGSILMDDSFQYGSDTNTPDGPDQNKLKPTARFKDLNTVESIPAGTPFCVRIKGVANDGIYKFKDIHVYPSTNKIEEAESYDQDKKMSLILKADNGKETLWEMKGNLYDELMPLKETEWVLSGMYYHGGGNASIKPYRSFFYAATQEGQALLKAMFGFTETTGITNLINDNTTNCSIYNLNGQLVRKNSSSVEGLAKGIYIVNGKRVVIK